MFELIAVKIAVLRSKSKDFWQFFFTGPAMGNDKQKQA
jgi:hypothetical protein